MQIEDQGFGFSFCNHHSAFCNQKSTIHNFMRSLLDFIKYNNAFPIILSVVILGTGAAFAASPDLRQAIFPSSASNSVPVAPKKTDTAKLLSTDTGAFDLALRIDAITEDAQAYHVAYSYTTLEVSGGEWREVRKTGKMDAWKEILGKRDLRDYVAEQLGQVIARELAYLSEARTAATAATAPKASGNYASLVGTEIDAETPVESGKNAVSDVSEGVSPDEPAAFAGTTLTEEEINDMIVKAVSDFLAIDTGMPEPFPEPSLVETPASAVENTSETAEPDAGDSAPDSDPGQ